MTSYRQDIVHFEVWDKTIEKWLVIPFKARCIEHDGRIYKLFRVGTLAKALGRIPGTVRRWEKSGSLPEPLYQIAEVGNGTCGDAGFRWYSEDQIRMVSYMQRMILGANPDKLRGAGLNTKGFFEAVKDNWGVVDFDSDDYEVSEQETGKNDVQL
jgi:hypothetical protein